MFTISYKGFYINGYIDKPQVRLAIKQWDRQQSAGVWINAKSMHAAKCLISRWINKGI